VLPPNVLSAGTRQDQQSLGRLRKNYNASSTSSTSSSANEAPVGIVLQGGIVQWRDRALQRLEFWGTDHSTARTEIRLCAQRTYPRSMMSFSVSARSKSAVLIVEEGSLSLSSKALGAALYKCGRTDQTATQGLCCRWLVNTTGQVMA